MKTLLLAALVLSSNAVAGEVVQCPERFPTKDLALADNPLGRIGVARLQPANLSNAFIQVGELHGEQGLQPSITKVKGGLNLHYGLPGKTKWLVCIYGGSERMVGSVDWWEKLNPKFSDCILRLRETKVPNGESNWTATATCNS
jgi:hypothetical protein